MFGVWDRGELDTFLIDFNDGSSVTVDGDHLWTVRQRTDHEWKTVNTISLFEKINLKNSKNYEVPVTLPVEFEGSDLPIPPYMMGGSWQTDTLRALRSSGLRTIKMSQTVCAVVPN